MRPPHLLMLPPLARSCWSARRGVGWYLHEAVPLLGKQRSVQPKGRREAAGAYGDRGSRRSIADVTSSETLAEVRAFKKAAKTTAKSACQRPPHSSRRLSAG